MDLSSEDISVIRAALALYLAQRRRDYHQQAATADTAETLRLSVAYESDKEYVSGLLDRLGARTMAVTSSHTESKGHDSD